MGGGVSRPAIGAPEHNGNQERVYTAVAHGHSLLGEIMEATGLEESTVRTALLRLKDAGRVDREPSPNQRHHTRYFVLRGRCLLAECWRGAAA